jgi:predicted AAA+ superfamily ATPase
MISRILEKPLKRPKSFFLLGPRGTGKTHWAKSHLSSALYIDLLKTEIFISLLANPSRLEAMIPDRFNDWVVIDEVQRVPELLNEVHRLIENKKYKFVLTGSSARNLRKKGVNLLAGRALMYKMYPLTILELGDSFELEKSLKYGQLPAAIFEPEPQDYLAAYVDTYLREEVMQEGLTRNISAFSRFLEVASMSQGCVINMAAIARETEVSQKNITGYFDILDDLLIGYRLPVFNKRAKRRIVSHPKFYFFDVGVYKSLRPKGVLDSEAELDGVGLETLFLQELRALNDYFELGYDLYYWRTQTGLEVDFILYGPKGFHAFEIKRASKVNEKDGKGLKAFHDEYPEAKLHLLYNGKQDYYFAKFEAKSIVSTLKVLKEILA